MSGRARPEPGDVVGIGYGMERITYGSGDAYWHHVRPDARTFGMFHPGTEPTVLELVADPDGPYKCWLSAGRDDFSMVQRHSIFEIQFPYGSESSERQGEGVAVRVSIRPAAG